MANVDYPRGFVPVRNIAGAPYTGGTVTCSTASGYPTALFIGDAVKLAGDASAEGYPTVIAATATGADTFGVVIGFEANPEDLSVQYGKASTAQTVYVVPVRDALFIAQADSGTAITSAMIGESAAIVLGAGNETYGTSGFEVDSSNVGTGTVVQLLGLSGAPDNDFGEHADLIVKFNDHALGGSGTPV